MLNFFAIMLFFYSHHFVAIMLINIAIMLKQFTFFVRKSMHEALDNSLITIVLKHE